MAPYIVFFKFCQLRRRIIKKFLSLFSFRYQNRKFFFFQKIQSFTNFLHDVITYYVLFLTSFIGGYFHTKLEVSSISLT